MIAAAASLMTFAVPAGFMPLGDAAAKLGVSPGHLRRTCQDKYARLGLALKGEGGAWAISKQADPRLGDLETEQGRDLRQVGELAREGYTAADIRRAERIRDLVKGFWQYQGLSRDDEGRRREYINGLSDGTLRDLYAPAISRCHTNTPAGSRCHTSTRTLRDWCDRYRQGGLRGLVRKQYPERGSTAFGENALDFFMQVMRVGHGISVRAAHDQTLGYILQNKLRDDQDWKLPALRTVQEWWKTRIPEPAKVWIAKGPHKMRANCLPKIVRNVRTDYAAGELVIGDERTFDFMAREYGERGWYRVRPKLTAWRDGVSGMIVG